jgi:hypothetical protein
VLLFSTGGGAPHGRGRAGATTTAPVAFATQAWGAAGSVGATGAHSNSGPPPFTGVWYPVRAGHGQMHGGRVWHFSNSPHPGMTGSPATPGGPLAWARRRAYRDVGLDQRSAQPLTPRKACGLTVLLGAGRGGGRPGPAGHSPAVSVGSDEAIRDAARAGWASRRQPCQGPVSAPPPPPYVTSTANQARARGGVHTGCTSRRCRCSVKRARSGRRRRRRRSRWCRSC